MKFKIHSNEHQDFFIVEGTFGECKKQCFDEITKRGWDDVWSEEI